MFEESLLERARQRRSVWSWMGLVVQCTVVGAVVVAPMMHPEMLSVILPSAKVYVPVKSVDPVEARASTTTAAATSSPYAAARPAARVFTAPQSWSHAVQTIIDGPEMSLLPPMGDGRVQAFSGPLVRGDGDGVNVTAPPPPPPPRVGKPEPPKQIRVGGDVQAANLIRRVLPVYPPLAKQARIQGLVKLEGIIAKDGTVQKLRLISGHPLLAPAAFDAVRQWLYKPTLLNGEPVEVIAPIDVNFVLGR